MFTRDPYEVVDKLDSEAMSGGVWPSGGVPDGFSPLTSGGCADCAAVVWVVSVVASVDGWEASSGTEAVSWLC